MAMSPSGSVHYYFNRPTAVVIKNSTSQIAAGVDVLGEGGMVLAPPSVKPGVGAYRWLNEGMELADAPDWLIAAKGAPCPSSAARGDSTQSTSKNWHARWSYPERLKVG
jgi:hypothetical protein